MYKHVCHETTKILEKEFNSSFNKRYRTKTWKCFSVLFVGFTSCSRASQIAKTWCSSPDMTCILSYHLSVTLLMIISPITSTSVCLCSSNTILFIINELKRGCAACHAQTVSLPLSSFALVNSKNHESSTDHHRFLGILVMEVYIY